MTSKEALEKLNNLIWRKKHINSERNKIVNDCVDTIKQDLERLGTLENEKLKKEKEQIKQWIINKIKYLDKGVFLMSGERVKGAIEILNELLKEVLNND